jgi:hypothetical protein
MIDFAMGKQLGHYRLIRLLGAGGFAEVYLGMHIHLKTLAAIKVLHTRLREEGLEQFRNEAYAIARLRHPHIVRLLDFGIEDSQIPYLVMDYLPRGTLRQVYAPGTQLPLPAVTLYTGQIAQALQYAHDARYIHRDVKPDNMLVEQSSHVLLSDFSLAVVAHSTHSQTAQQMAGTIGYMAPEQIEEYPRPASDQYALGVVVYEWLCGQRPFHGTMLEILTKHCSVPPPPLRTHNPTLSPDVERVVLRALEKEWQARFPTIGEFARALEQAAHAPAVGLSGPSLFPSSSSGRASVSARPGPSAPLPIDTAMSGRKQIVWMLSYLVLAFVAWIPYCVGFLVDAIRGTADASLPIPLLIYLLFLYLLHVPASVLLAGALFGGWRGGGVTTVYTGIIAFLVAAPLLFWGRVVSGTTVIFYAILFCSWPLATLVTGVFCQRRLRRGFGKTYIAMLPGLVIMIAGFVPLVLIASPAATSSDIATSLVLLLFGIPILAGILALPVAACEILIERLMERAQQRQMSAEVHRI